MAKAHVHAVVEGCMLVTERENIISYGEECLFIHDWAALCVVSGGWPMPLKLRGFCMMLQKIMFLKVSIGMDSNTSRNIEFNLHVTNKMLLFAANWTIEQAIASDFQLHLLWPHSLVSLRPHGGKVIDGWADLLVGSSYVRSSLPRGKAVVGGVDPLVGSSLPL
ncbi:hypothetical protein Q3G72_008675 [Acer saccharum]|nr:hypothetical protein Q3G72_008675 [Acer saccharum]